MVPTWTWTGCFAGAHTGGLWANATGWVVRTPDGAHFGESLGGHGLGSVIGGLQAGCDHQFGVGIVVGARGDYAWANARGSHDSAREFGVAYQSSVTGLASATLRVGYAWDRVLGYVRGGAAWQRAEYSASTILTGTAYAARETRSGWTIGAGGEYAITDCLSAFAEYGYYNFGNRQVGFTPQIAGLRRGLLDIGATTNVVRIGISFRFGAGFI